MGLHVEWFSTKYLTVGIHAAGDEIGEDTVNDGNVAVTFGEDTVVVIEGTPADVERRLQEALDMLKAAEAPPAFPMPTPDGEQPIEGDEVTCPHRDDNGAVCGAVMEAHERIWDYRSTHWAEARNGDAVISIGDGKLGDGEFHAFVCENGHEFAPDWERTDYGW